MTRAAGSTKKIKRRRRISPPLIQPGYFPYSKGAKVKTDKAEAIDQRAQLNGILNRYRALPNGPFFFIEDWLNINPNPWLNDKPPAYRIPPDVLPIWTKQRETIQKIFKHKKVAVKSANGVGKTFTAALISLIFLYVYKGIVITTGKSWRQVKEQLWGEIHRIHRGANLRLKEIGRPELGGKLNQTDLHIAPKWYAVGFSTDEPDRFRGFHGERLLLIVDEACGVPKEAFEAMEGVLTSEESYVLFIGNPTDPTGKFADCFKPNSGYHCISISAFDSPNVRHERQIYPELTSLRWVEDKKRTWGVDSPMYKACVSAEFPTETEDTLIPLRYIQAALDRELSDNSEIVSYGLDVARFGSDRTMLGRRRVNGQFRFVWEQKGKATTATAGRAMATWLEECVTKDENGQEERWEAPINVDDIGVGGGVTDILEEEGIPVNGIDVARAPEDTVEDEHAELFLNCRAQYFWRVKKLFEKGEIDIDDEELAEELSRIKYEYQRGKIKIMKKEDFKKLYGISPDKADALMLAWAESEALEGQSLGGWL